MKYLIEIKETKSSRWFIEAKNKEDAARKYKDYETNDFIEEYTPQVEITILREIETED